MCVIGYLKEAPRELSWKFIDSSENLCHAVNNIQKQQIYSGTDI